MNLKDKAQETPEVSLARQSAPAAYILLDDELTAADELTPEDQFPQFGDFASVAKARAVDDGHEPSDQEQWIECPQDLARWLVDQDATEGFAFRVKQVTKVDGEWQYDCETLTGEPDE